jgi:hypothetical protein
MSRGPDSLRYAKDFRALYPGTCGRCHERFPVDTVLMRGVYGIEHKVCPRDRSDSDTPDAERGAR